MNSLFTPRGGTNHRAFQKFFLRNLLTLAVVLFTFFSAQKLEASHFRGGTITWRVTSGRTVEFTVTTKWRENATNRPTITTPGIAFNLISDVIQPATGGVSTRVTKYTATFASDGPFRVSWGSCCRIGGLGNGGGSWTLFTTVNLSGGNENSPVSSLPPIVNVPDGSATATFSVPANDLDGDQLTYRLANSTELNGSNPPDISINSQTGQVTVNTTNSTYSPGRLFFTGVVISDGKAEVMIDYLLQITNTSTPPEFVYGPTPADGTVIQLSPGQNTNFQVQARDVDQGGTIATLFASGLPNGATYNVSSGNPATSNFSWTPTASDFGTYVLNFIAQDNIGVQASTSVVLQVSLKPQFDSPPTPSSTEHTVYTPGDVVNYNVQASDPDPTDLVRIIKVEGKNMMGDKIPLYNGASFNPLPTAAANPTVGTFNWPTQASDWGHRHVYFTAEDSFGDQTVYEVPQLINTVPQIASNPVLQVNADEAYTYNIAANDPDILYGDEVTIVSAQPLPAWLNLSIDPATGTAVLSGTPSMADAGDYNISLLFEDTHHHTHLNIPEQNFVITVIQDVTPPSIVCAEDVSVNAGLGLATAQVQVTPPLCEECGYTQSTENIVWPLQPYGSGAGAGLAFATTQDYTFSGPFPTATEDAVLTINLSGDINNTFNEYVDLRTESGTILDSRINSADGNINRTYSISASDFNAWASDGTITFTLIGPPQGTSNVNGGSGSMRLDLASEITLVNDFTGTEDASGTYPLGNTTVTWTATDAAGNQSSCTQTITVLDTERPVISVQDITVNTDDNTCDAIVSNFAASATDNSGTVGVSFDLAEGTTFALGSTLVTATATDSSGNTSQATFNVIVEDNTKPIVLTQDLVINLDENGDAVITANQIDNGSMDNCSIQSLSLDITSFDCNDLGDNTVTLTVTDGSGNIESATAMVTVKDITAPNVITKDITVALDANGSASILPSQIDNGSSDNCGIESLLFGVSGDNGGQRIVQVNSGTRSGRSLTGISYTYNGESKTLTPANAISSQLVLSTLTAGAGDANRFWDHSASSISEERALGVLGDFDLGTAFQDCADPAGVKHDVMFDTPIIPGAGPEVFIVHGGLTQNIQILDTDGNVALTIASSAGSSNVVIGGSNFATRFNGFYLRNNVNFSAQLQGTHGDRQDRVLALDINASEVPEIGGVRFGGGSCNYTYEILGFQPEQGTANQLDFDCSDLGEHVVTLQATDASGNASTETATVTIVDETAPSVIGKPISVTLTANGTVSITADQITESSNDNCGPVVMSASQTVFGAQDALNSPVTVQLTGSDPSGNATTIAVPVTVIDPVPVVITQNITVSLDANGAAVITPDQIDNGSSSVVGLSGLALDVSSFDCANLGAPVTVTLTATSTLGSTASGTAKVTIVDNISPTAITQNVVIDLVNGGASVTPAQVNNGSFDNCGITSLTLDREFFSCADVGDQTVTLTVTDANGNSNSQTAIVTVRDVTAPFLNVINRTFGLDNNGQLTIVPRTMYNSSNDDCGGPVTVTIDKDTFDCTNLGENVITVTSTDESGNQNIKQAILTIVDAAEPEVNVIDYLVVELDETGNASIIFEDIDTGTRDNCGIDRVEVSQTEFTCADVGALVVTTRAWDVNGNMDVNRGRTLIEVRDVTAPTVITQNISVDLSSGGNVSITPEQINNGSSDVCGPVTLELDRTAFGCSDIGTNTVTLTVRDASGNSSTATAVVTVNDVTPPVINTINRTFGLDENGQLSLTPRFFYNSLGDACGGEVTVTTDVSSWDCTNLGENEVKVTATDARGNSVTQTSILTIVDAAEPTPVAKDVITVQLDENGQATITPQDVDNGTFDNCGVASLHLDRTTFTCADLGSLVVNLTATDVNGNESVNRAQTIVIVEDKIVPTVVTQNITIALGADGTAQIIPSMVDNGSSDNCNVDLSLDVFSFDCTNIGSNTVNLTATDASGNSSSMEAIVTVIDNVAPTIVANNIEVQLDENGSASIAVSDVDGGTSDNCGVASITIDIESFTCDSLGENIVTLTATDVNGNVSTGTAVVTVVDVIAPTVGAQDISIDLDENGLASISPEDVLILSEDDIETGDDCTVSAAESHAVWLSNYLPSDGTGEISGISSSAGPDSQLSKNWSNYYKKKKKGPKKKDDDDDDGDDDDDDNGKIKPKNTRFVFDPAGGSIHRELDGTATVTGRIVSTQDANDQWIVTLNLANGRDWDEWSALGRSYKDEKRLAGNRFQDWTYYEMAEGSQLMGAGRNAGEVISLSHAPTDYRYGFQLGEAANSKNGNFGMSGWFFYTNRAGKQVQGDFNLDITDCQSTPPPSDAVITGDNCGIASTSLSVSEFSCSNLGENLVQVTVTDQSGNATTKSVSVRVNDRIAPVAIAENITVSVGENGTVEVDPATFGAMSTDNSNCDLTYSLDRTTFDCSDVGKGSYYYTGDTEYKGSKWGWGYVFRKKNKKRGHKVTLTVTDAAGNSSSTTAYISVVDDVAPVISDNPITVVVYGRRSAYLSKRDVANAVTDNCKVRGIYFPRKRYSRKDAGLNSVPVKAFDYSGNMTRGTVSVNVVDISSYGRYVDICYEGKTRRVRREQVQNYIRKGASIGACQYFGRAGSSTPATELITDEKAFSPELKLSTYPNPTSGYTVVSFSSQIDGPAKVSILSTNGVEMDKLFDDELNAYEEVEVGYEAGHLPSGIYIVRMITAGEVKTVKLVVRK